MVMGRPNKGVGHVDGCEGSVMSKKRLRVILETIAGDLSVDVACAKLGLQRPRFAQLRAMALQGSVDVLEPGIPGRPRKHDVERDEEVAKLKEQNERLQMELAAAKVKAELAHIVPWHRQAAEKGGGRVKRRNQ